MIVDHDEEQRRISNKTNLTNDTWKSIIGNHTRNGDVFLPQFHTTECKIDCFVGDHGSKWVAFAVGKVGFMDTVVSFDV